MPLNAAAAANALLLVLLAALCAPWLLLGRGTAGLSLEVFLESCLLSLDVSLAAGSPGASCQLPSLLREEDRALTRELRGLLDSSSGKPLDRALRILGLGSSSASTMWPPSGLRRNLGETSSVKYVSRRVLICCSLTPSCEGDMSSISSGWLLERPSLGPPGVEGAGPMPTTNKQGFARNLGACCVTRLEVERSEAGPPGHRSLTRFAFPFATTAGLMQT